MSIEDVLSWIDRRFVCGTLTVEHDSVVRSLHFDSGYLTSASSNTSGEHLGSELIGRGLITEDQLAEAFEVQGDTGVLLGKILIMVGAVDEEQLRGALEDKIREAICDVLHWREGTFLFEPDLALERVNEFEISVNLSEALDEGLARARQWHEIRTLVPSDDAVLTVKDAGKVARLPVDEERCAELQNIVEHVEAGMSVNDIVTMLGGRRFLVLTSVADLLEAGVLMLDSVKAIRLKEVSELEGAARGRAAGGDRMGALELVRRAIGAEPDNDAIKYLLEELERTVLAELSRDLLGRFCVPKLLKDVAYLEKTELSDCERYLAGRIDGRWDLMSLMRGAPFRQVEALIGFKRLADRGIIEL